MDFSSFIWQKMDAKKAVLDAMLIARKGFGARGGIPIWFDAGKSGALWDVGKPEE